VATHGTQQPLEILEAMDVRGVFNEFGRCLEYREDRVRPRGPERLVLDRHARGGLLLLRNMDGLMHAGKWPRSDFFLYATSVCDNVKAFQVTLSRATVSPASA